MTSNHRALEESDIELIERVKESPALYDPRNSDFRLSYRKDQEWERVAESCGMNHWEARKRWICLRDRYARELKQLLMHSEKSEFGSNDFFKRMDFLRMYVRRRRDRKRSNQHSPSSAENTIKINKLLYYDTKQTGMDATSNSDTCEEQLDTFEYVDPNQESVIDSKAFIAEHEECYYEGNKNSMIANVDVPMVTPTSVTEAKLEYNVHDALCLGGQLLSQLHKEPSIKANANSHYSYPPAQGEEFFSKTVAIYLRQLSRRYKIKAQVEIMQILEKYVNFEESERKQS